MKRNKFINIQSLDVLLNNKNVGRLSIVDSKIAFQYHHEWIKNGFSISPFNLPLENKVFYYEPKHHKPIWGVFLDSLPDGWGIRLSIKECTKKILTI